MLVRRDRWQVTTAHTRWLSERPEVPGSRSWGSACPRIVTWVELEDRRGGPPWVFANTHLDHHAPRARREQARVLLELLRAVPAGARRVVTGDFNAAPGSPVHAQLTAGFLDAWEVAATRAGPPETFHDFTGEPRPGTRIDWVLVGPELAVSRAETVTTHRGGRYPSDHFPLVVDLQG